jgi:hypothetical protein
VVWIPSKNYLERRTDFTTAEQLITQIYDIATPDTLVGCVEHVHSMKSDGRKSAWTFGLAYGMAQGALMLRKIPFIEVAPLRWQNFIRKTLHWRWDEEFDSRKAAKQIIGDKRYDHLFKRVKDHNTGDAFCMAYWLAEHSRLLPESSNKTGLLTRLPTMHELEQLRAERLRQQVPVVQQVHVPESGGDPVK